MVSALPSMCDTVSVALFPAVILSSGKLCLCGCGVVMLSSSSQLQIQLLARFMCTLFCMCSECDKSMRDLRGGEGDNHIVGVKSLLEQ